MSSSKIVIAGGSGFIGRACRVLFEKQGYQVVVLTRNPKKHGEVSWDGKTLGSWTGELTDALAVVNLTGSSISVKFTQENLHEIERSRVESTHAIGDALGKLTHPPIWINASAVGFYGDTKSDIATETSALGQGILPAICLAWENAILDHPTQCKKTILRIGVVLGNEGGALVPLKKLTKAFLGGAVDSGDQFISWIHVLDVVRMILWAIEHGKEGVYNATAPEPVTNAKLMQSLRAVLRRPWSPPVPGFLIRTVGKLIGPDASLLLDSQRARPKRALDEGFVFQFPKVEDALADLVGQSA